MNIFIYALFLSCLSCTAVVAQSAHQNVSPGAPHGEQHKLLDLRRYHLGLQEAKATYDSRVELFREGLVSRLDLEGVKTEFLQAQMLYQQAFLKLFSEVPRISVVNAIKSMTSEGKRFVTITLRNSSASTLDYRQLGVVEGEAPIPDELKLRELNNLFVSVKDEDGIGITRPYEVFISSLSAGEERVLNFDLLKDVESVVVSVAYSGMIDEREVYLQKDASANIVTVQSEQFSQEADLGGEAVYDMRLERFTSNANIFKLQVINLPRQIDWTFLSSVESDTRLNQVKFTEGETTKDLALRLHLPLVSTDQDAFIDEPIRFWVLALSEDLSSRYVEDQRYSKEEVAQIPSGKVALEIVPRGVGVLEVMATNLYHEIERGNPVNFGVSVDNIGTRSLNNIQIIVSAPVDWSVTVEPQMIGRLEVRENQKIDIELVPPMDIPVGDYNVKIATEAYASERLVKSEDKVARVAISTHAPLWQTGVALGLLVGVILGVVIVGIRLTRR